MMLGNRIDHGLIGYQAPPTPRAARSVRRRCSFKRKDYGQQMCAFDLLATVAGKLLLEAKDSPPLADSSSGNDQHIVVENSDKEDKLLEEKTCHERNFMFTKLVSGDLDRNDTGCSEKPDNAYAEQLVNSDDCKLRLGISAPSLDIELPNVKHSSYAGSGDDGGEKMMINFASNRNLSVSYRDSSSSSSSSSSSKLGVKEPLDRKSGVLVSSIDSVKFPICKDQRIRASVPNNRDNVKLVNRDDDENDSDCFEPMHRDKAYSKSPDRRLKKLLVPEHCKTLADMEDSELRSPDDEGCSYMNRERVLKRQRSIKDYPIKKRKLYDCSSMSGHEEDVSNDGTYSSLSVVPQNGCDGIRQCSAPINVGAISNQSHVPGGHASFQPRNNQVKLRIKSVRVPELHIEIPETATVGCLKRVVMEAVNSVLGGGLRVGVLLQGTKIRDDTKTLLQTGISMDNLGFCLEPDNNGPLPINVCPSLEDGPRGILHHSPQPLARYPPISGITQNGFHQIHHHPGNFDSPRSVNRNSFLNNLIERDHHDSAPPLTDMVASDKASSEPKAIVPVIQAVKQEPALSARKCKRSESAQRRIRRPFTAAEVEALVQAVEKLGTGRWRDVKLRAFDRAKHRTYVDLKDKWKTLVHTARISPQQRRGEPVPQQLLDRVLTAQAYWYHQQAKQHLKSTPSPCLLL